jgi:hypothetical protein
MNMNFLHHVIIPSLLPIAFFAVAFFAVAATPVEVLGCRNRGLLALLIAFVSVLAGLAAAVRAVQGRGGARRIRGGGRRVR